MASGIFSQRNINQLRTLGGLPGVAPPIVDYLVVAGGGGAGASDPGGGGAGGLLQGFIPVTIGSTITATVGAGGAGRSGATVPGSGGDSTFGSITATGGGYGATASTPGGTGGSGGGAGTGAYAAMKTGRGIANQGNNGGLSSTSAGAATGGGGGAGTPGIRNGGSIGGNGGAGIASDISGTRTTYAGGGGGSGSGGGGSGGAGGGGAGATGTNGTNGTTNTGGGGGGANNYTGGSGGSGVIIISYPDIYANAVSQTNATYSTSGSGSFSFNGSSQTISTAASSLLALGSGDFTIEFWVKVNGSGTFSRPFLITGSASVSIECNTYTSSTTPYYLNYAGTQTAVTTGSSFDVTQWHHVAIVRSGTTNKVYLNGVQALSATDATNYSSNGTLYLGSNNSANWLNGNVTNFRLVKGTAVYTTAFTPPTAPLTSISGTSILTSAISGAYLADNSGNAFTFTNTGSTAWNSASPFPTGLGYKNRVYTWTSSGTIRF